MSSGDTGEVRRVERPSLRDFKTLEGYRRAFRRYAEWRYETDQADPHHEQDYPLVRRCPKCHGVSVVSLISVVDDPVWLCKTGRHQHYVDYFAGSEDYDD